MRNSVIIVLSALVLLAEALVAHAEVGGPVIPPTIGTANPPAAGSEVGAPSTQKPVDNQAAGLIASGTDTSTAAPGGQAESSANGALSTPPNGKPVHPTHGKAKPATDTSADTPK